MLTKELVYMVLDELKIHSDDSYFTEGHIVFLCKKYRSMLIKREQEKNKEDGDIASEFEYQQICLDLEKVPAIDGAPCIGGYYLKSTQEIPTIMAKYSPVAYPIDFYQGTHVAFVSRNRMRYVGSNPYLQNVIYASLGPDKHLYLDSNNPQFLYLKKIRISAVFEDFDEAASLLCDSAGQSATCDVLEMEFPIRDYLVPVLIELVVKELAGVKYQPKDDKNNASDDLSKMSVS